MLINNVITAQNFVLWTKKSFENKLEQLSAIWDNQVLHVIDSWYPSSAKSTRRAKKSNTSRRDP
jgi:hypothetical protein